MNEQKEEITGAEQQGIIKGRLMSVDALRGFIMFCCMLSSERYRKKTFIKV